ncbi:MAG: Tol-Pal system beta propeller repeat protein TolB [Wenzhouxiangellaceae bacterium]|nr:Tol-Pal system beta propeller repeat protein TolB [Wenzhouxiangellaceae bacterium]
MKLNSFFATTAISLLLALAGPVRGQLQIEIVDGVEGALPVAVVPFAFGNAEFAPETPMHEVIAADLQRSGLFETLPVADMIDRPSRPPEVQFGTWRLLKVDYVVMGRWIPAGDGINGEIEYHLVAVATGRTLFSRAIAAGPGVFRLRAHQIADAVYEELTGIPGAFATRIAYVKVSDAGTPEEMFELIVADADGHNPQTIVRHSQPILSPAWAPDARRLAYVSFATGRSNVVIQDIFTGQRDIISDERGINGAPAFSPDGRYLAMSLSRGGSPDLWLRDLQTGRMEQLTRHHSINTEPAFARDGRHIYFTSDRAGQPQIYRIRRDGSDLQRVTTEGRYNSRASIDPSNGLLAMVHGERARFRIGVLDPDSGRLRVLSNGPMDESPSFAPNGQMLLYATREAEQGVLAAVSVDGRFRQRLVLAQGDVREPAWSPRMQQ